MAKTESNPERGGTDPGTSRTPSENHTPRPNKVKPKETRRHSKTMQNDIVK